MSKAEADAYKAGFKTGQAAKPAPSGFPGFPVLSAGPRVSKGFEGKPTEVLMHPRRPGIDIGDDDPDFLIQRHPVRDINARESSLAHGPPVRYRT
jgi:hypothetical protein